MQMVLYSVYKTTAEWRDGIKTTKSLKIEHKTDREEKKKFNSI